MLERSLLAISEGLARKADEHRAGPDIAGPCRKSLARFVQEGWEVLEPDVPLIWNWHLDAVCDHLEACTRHQLWNPDKEPKPDRSISDLIINIPPGHMKSLLVAVFWPAWEWIDAPFIRSIFGSYALDLSLRDAVRCRDLIESDWYRSTFRPDWELKADQNNKSYYRNTRGGDRLSIGTNTRVTGFRGHKVVVDDAINAQDAYSEVVRTSTNHWWGQSMATRFNDPRKRTRVVMGQRLHTEDLPGVCIAKGGYELLCLPTEFDPQSPCRTSIGFVDPRREQGELLFPALYPAEVVRQAHVDLGPVDFSAQHNQKPTPPGGRVFKTVWWRYWQPTGAKLPPVKVQDDDGVWQEIEAVEIPARFDEVAQSWDMSFKDTKTSDFVAGGVYGRSAARLFLLDRVNSRLSFPATCDAVRSTRARWPATSAIYIEDKANGPAVIATLQNDIPGVIAVTPEGGKESRAHAVTRFVQAGNVYLPHPALYPWVTEFIKQHSDFPGGSHDDEVDQFTQAATQLLARMPIPQAPAGRTPSSNRNWTGYQPR